MAREQQVKIRLTAEDDASPTLGRVEKAFRDLSQTISDRFVITAGDAERAVRALIDVFTSSIQAAADTEESVAALSAALKNLGPGAEDSIDSLLEFAEAQQKITKNSDDSVIAAQALLATFGVAPSKINAATLAAENLAAAMGTDLRSAAIAVGGTFNGITRGIDKIVPGLKSLSDEALRTGAAVEVMNEALGGRAAAAAETFEGRLIRLENQINELQKTLGNVVVQSKAVSEVIQLLTTSISGLNVAMKAGASSADVFTSRIASLLSPVSDFARVLKALPGALNTLIGVIAAAATAVGGTFAKAWDDAKKAVEAILEPLRFATEAFQAQAAGISGGIDVLKRHENAVKRAMRIDEEWGANLETVGDIAKRLGVTISLDLTEKLAANAAEQSLLNELIRSGQDVTGDYAKVLSALVAEQARLTAELNGTATAARNAANAFDELARAMIPVNAGGLTLSQQITYAGGGSVVSGSQGGPINGGKFGGGKSINAQSRLPPISR